MRVLAALVAIALLAPVAQPQGVDPGALELVRRDEARRVAVFERAARSVVCVFASRDGVRRGGGSGVVISPDGYGLTNFHVVAEFADSRRGVGALSDGRLYPLTLLGIDPGGDVAMFKLEGRETFDYAPLGDADALVVGQWVAAMGNPFVLAEDYTPSITLGVVSGLHRYQEGQGNLLEYADCIQVSTSINPGNSGGPLFDLEGRVVGINGRASFEERGRVNVGLGYAITINQVRRFIPSLRAGRMTEHGTLGATVRLAGREVIFDAIQDFSPAEKAGVRLGDEMLTLNGRSVRTPNDYNTIIAALPADWPVALRVRRGEQVLELSARLERVAVRAGAVWVPDAEHNRGEVRRQLERHARRAGLAAPMGRVAAARAATLDEAGRESASLPVRLYYTPEGGLEVSSDGLRIALPGDAAMSTGASDEPLADPRLWQEWWRISGPLLVAPAALAEWELLGGDEVDGRIVSVVEWREPGVAADRATRVRWSFALDDDELLRVTVGDGADPARITWRPHEPRVASGVRWLGTWLRTQAGVPAVRITFDGPWEEELP